MAVLREVGEGAAVFDTLFTHYEEMAVTTEVHWRHFSQGSGFRVQGSGLRVQSSGFRVQVIALITSGFGRCCMGAFG